MSRRIRKAIESDLTEIIRLDDELSDHHSGIDDYFLPASDMEEEETRGWLNEIMDREDALLLVVDKGKGKRLGGYFVGEIGDAKQFVAPDREGHIAAAYVEPDCRGEGFSRRAIERFKKWFREEGVTSVRLSVHSQNEEAIRAWQSLGFEEYMKKMRLEGF